MNRSITLSAGEWRIMERLWERSPRTLTELVRELGPETGWSKSTIVTMVGRLEGKGALTYTEGGRARQYAPAVPREQAALEETESLLRRVYRGSVGMMMSAMAQRQELSGDEIAELRAILDQAEKGGPQ